MNYLLVAEIPHANDFFLVMEGVTRSNWLQMPYSDGCVAKSFNRGLSVATVQ